MIPIFDRIDGLSRGITQGNPFPSVFERATKRSNRFDPLIDLGKGGRILADHQVCTRRQLGAGGKGELNSGGEFPA